MERKHRKHYLRVPVLRDIFATVPEGRIVMKGSWVFSVYADEMTSKIVFKARWGLYGYSTIRSVTFVSSYEDVPLETRFTQHEQTRFEGPSIFG